MNYEQKYKEALEKARQFIEHPLQEDGSSFVTYKDIVDFKNYMEGD